MRSIDYMLVFRGGRLSAIHQSNWYDVPEVEKLLDVGTAILQVEPHHFGPSSPHGSVAWYSHPRLAAMSARCFKLASRLAILLLEWNEPRDLFVAYGEYQAEQLLDEVNNVGFGESPHVPELVDEVECWGNAFQRGKPFHRHLAVYEGFERVKEEAAFNQARYNEEGE